MAPHLYLIAYDIADSKRLRRVARAMEGRGDRVQFSVFSCRLSNRERELLISDLLGIIHQREDRVVIVDLGPADGVATARFRFLGRPDDLSDQGPVVI